MQQAVQPTYDCVVFSGGGAKGAYGAGAYKALAEYRRLKNVERPLCFLGASAGALNAAVAAMFDADKLIGFWRAVTNRDILGVRLKSSRYQMGKGLLRRLPLLRKPQAFHVYPNDALRRLIEQKTSFDALTGKHLVVAVTDYTEGSLKAFYHSDLIAEFVAEDARQLERNRRLNHFRPLTRENLTDCLLASSAIPIFFPAVRIEQHLYIDGGVGNNSPTREAAYFFRYLEKLGRGQRGEAYCILLEPPRQRQEEGAGDGLLDVVDRTLSIYHHVHTDRIINAWFRINREVERHEEAVNRLLAWIRGQRWNPQMVTELTAVIQREFAGLGEPTLRQDVRLHRVEPSGPLGKTLDFERETIARNITIGYQDMLKVLASENKVDNTELQALRNAPL